MIDILPEWDKGSDDDRPDLPEPDVEVMTNDNMTNWTSKLALRIKYKKPRSVVVDINSAPIKLFQG